MDAQTDASCPMHLVGGPREVVASMRSVRSRNGREAQALAQRASPLPLVPQSSSRRAGCLTTTLTTETQPMRSLRLGSSRRLRVQTV
jgi:hypothetical protein